MFEMTSQAIEGGERTGDCVVLLVCPMMAPRSVDATHHHQRQSRQRRERLDLYLNIASAST